MEIKAIQNYELIYPITSILLLILLFLGKF